MLSAYIVPHPPLIIPSVGLGREGEVQSTIAAYDRIAQKIAAANPDTIIFITPHSVMYSDYFHISPGKNAEGGLSTFGSAERFSIEYDDELSNVISSLSEQRGIPAGTDGERNPSVDHGVMVPLYFINKYMKSFKAVRISVSGLPLQTHYEFGRLIRNAIDSLNRKAVIIASGDLSHRLKDDGSYGFAPEGPEFDRIITSAMKTGDFKSLIDINESLCEAAGECGLRPIIVMSGAMDGMTIKSELLSYEDPFGVGYGVCCCEPEHSPYVRLARKALETYVKTGEKIKVSGNEGIPDKRAGVFVSLKKNGDLRGCIGTIMPMAENVSLEIINNAISSGTADPRFNPVTEDELPQLVYSVDELGAIMPVSDINELDVKKYGIIVSNEYRRGLLLPDLEGVDTVSEQISIALRKAGISSSEKYMLEKFEVVRYR